MILLGSFFLIGVFFLNMMRGGSFFLLVVYVKIIVKFDFLWFVVWMVMLLEFCILIVLFIGMLNVNGILFILMI